MQYDLLTASKHSKMIQKSLRHMSDSQKLVYFKYHGWIEGRCPNEFFSGITNNVSAQSLISGLLVWDPVSSLLY